MNASKGYLYFICCVSAMGGLLFGYDWVVIGGAKPFYELYFAIAASPLMQGVAMTTALVGCLAGAMVVLVVAAISAYAMTLGPVTWTLLAEIFPNRIRGVAMATCTFALWVGCCTLTFSFPPDINAVFDHGKRAVSSFPIAMGIYYKMDYSAGVDISNYKNIYVPASYMGVNSRFQLRRRL